MADWRDTLAEIAPTIGSLFGPLGTAGGLAIKAVLGLSPEASGNEIQEALLNPDSQVKIKQMEYDYKASQAQAEAVKIQAVNTSIQAETKSEHWMQWAWRPFNGFLFGITLFLNYAIPALINALIIPFLSVPHAPITPGVIPEMVFTAWGAVLGVAAWTRGMQKANQAKP